MSQKTQTEREMWVAIMEAWTAVLKALDVLDGALLRADQGALAETLLRFSREMTVRITFRAAKHGVRPPSI